jgi:uracil-DNA glycosylase family 4
MSPELKVIYDDWHDCKRCPLGELSFRRVLWDTIPKDCDTVDVLFCGEGPGSAEDNLGKPFKGPAGRLLRGVLNKTRPREITVGFTNLVACKPQDQRGAAFRQPNSLEIETCQPRLIDTIKAFRPIVLVPLGRVADDWLYEQIHYKSELSNVKDYIPISHPSTILRQGGEENWKAYDPYVELFEELFRRIQELKNPTVARFNPVGRA